MQGFIIIIILGFLFFLILRNKIKLNIITYFFISLIAVSLFHLTKPKEIKVSFKQFENNEQLMEIWDNYSDYTLENDIKFTRTLNPYKVYDDSILEPNSVVTDDKNIYSISLEKVIVTNASSLIIEKELEYNKNYKPLLLNITNDKLVVIGEVNNKTRVYIYNKNNMSEFKNFEIDATYITSRVIDNYLYLVSSKIIDNKSKTKIPPSYIINGEKRVIPYKNIYYINNTYPNNFVNILKTSLNELDDTNVVSYLGLGQTVYFAPKNIYLAEEKYAKETGNSNKTIIIKYDSNSLRLTGLQEVTGYVLDQYSLDEYDGYLRIATSKEEEDNFKDSNNVYVLDNEMKIVGKLEDFSVGNEIQAATFIGDKAYIETFNILDPFYVIDFSNVKKPEIISEMKFEGYNTNFIPYDKNHILAFGLVLDDKKQANGIKVSLYDVTNPKSIKIVSMDTIMYKDYNSAYTDVLYDSKSLLLDRDKGILGFPIIYWINEIGSEISYYKQFYSIYKINPNSLKKLGKISHYEKNQINNTVDDIKRGLIISNKLYTVSDRKIKENSLDDLKLINEVNL